MPLEVTHHRPQEDDTPEGRFYFSFAAPEAYLAAERVLQTVPFVAPWTPIRAPDDARAFRCRKEEQIEFERLRQIAAARKLQPLLMPPPFDDEVALRVATFAKSIGRVVAFTLAAFRQAYAGGADLSDTDSVLIAAVACEMHPRAVLAAIERPTIERALTAATAEATALGVRSVPAIVRPDGVVLHGDQALGLIGA